MGIIARGGSSPPSRTRAAWTLAFVLLTLVPGHGCSGPESIVLEAVDSARDADHEAYLACFTARSRALIEAVWLVSGRVDPSLVAIGAGEVSVLGFRELAPRHQGPSRGVVRIQEDGREVSLVLHANFGAWRIDLPDTERLLSGSASPF